MTNASEVVSKNRKVEDEEADVENNQRKNSKITILREAIDDAHIELRQSIRDTMDSLSSDIEGKGSKITMYIRDRQFSFSRGPQDCHQGYCDVSGDAGGSGHNPICSWYDFIEIPNILKDLVYVFREAEGF